MLTKRSRTTLMGGWCVASAVARTPMTPLAAGAALRELQVMLTKSTTASTLMCSRCEYQ
jgi:hypothetical protein